MQWGTITRTPGSRPLLPEPLRAAGAALLAACVATVLVAFVAGRGNPGRLDTALDPRFQSWLGRFPALLHQLPRLGGLKEVSLMTVALVLVAFAAGRGNPGRLDTTLDPRFQAWLGRFPVLLHQLPRLGGLPEVALITLALAVAAAATRNWSGAVLAVVAVPGAVGLTEYVLKPYVGSVINQAFPSGHATSSFALAAVFAILLTDPAYRRVPRALRLLLVLIALLLAAAVAATMIAIGAHVFTDAVAGAAVGTGVVLACALTLDLAVSRAWRPAAEQSDPAYPDKASR